ncbi:MAG: DUF6434 domain-containing protein [Acidobacteriota bacterium]
MATQDPIRPPAEIVTSRQEFERWYWPVEDLQLFCERLNLSKAGRKADLRARVAGALDGTERVSAPPAKPRKKSRFKWSKEALTDETLITDNISFGPKVRRFFADRIGPAFVCHGDFMAWVRANEGRTLAEAVEAWHLLESRKDDPDFRREIASCNNYLQYLRGIRDAHPELSQEEAKACWDAKKIRPADEGFVIYEPADLRFLSAAPGAGSSELKRGQDLSASSSEEA